MGAKVWGPQILVRALMEEGIHTNFGISGGHMNSFDDYWSMYGNKLIHCRHESSAGFAAEAYAKVTGKIGLTQATVGPGVANLVPAINQAFLSNTPLICILGQTPLADRYRNPFQPLDGKSLYRDITRWAREVIEPSTLATLVQQAARDCMGYPPLPVALEVPLNFLEFAPQSLHDPMGQANYRIDRTHKRPWEQPQPVPSDDEVDAIIGWLLEAERPVVVIGHGGRWPDCGAALAEFVGLTQVPIHQRRVCRGTVPENHPLHVAGEARGAAFAKADRFLTLGLRFDVLEAYGQWGKDKRFVQVTEAPSEIWPEITTDIEAIGNVNATLRKLSRRIRESYADRFRGKTAWRDEILEIKIQAHGKMLKRMDDLKGRYTLPNQINPDVSSTLIAEYLHQAAPETTVILDSFTLSPYMSEKFQAGVTGGVLDAGINGGIGHGIGMGIGAQVGRPGKPVVSIMGDAGMGALGGDIETAVRERLPVVYVVHNNGAWIGGWNAMYGRDWHGAQNPHARDTDNGMGTLDGRTPYAKMYGLIGCHAETVTTHDGIAPALERALHSGKPAVVDLYSDPNSYHTLWDRGTYEGLFFVMLHHLPEELWTGMESFKERTRKIMNALGYPQWPKAPRLFPPFDEKEDFEWVSGPPPKYYKKKEGEGK
ncbi:MAG: thiamine pyrophosphate-binding protein [Thermodesulfobacteriota bacterium]